MIGSLVYADVFDAPDPALLDDAEAVVETIEAACRLGRATVLQTHYHRFEPQGLTAFCILAESHAAIHTYPEESAYMVDVFTCGESADPQTIVETIVDRLGGTTWFERAGRGRCSKLCRLTAAQAS